MSLAKRAWLDSYRWLGSEGIDMNSRNVCLVGVVMMLLAGMLAAMSANAQSVAGSVRL